MERFAEKLDKFEHKYHKIGIYRGKISIERSEIKPSLSSFRNPSISASILGSIEEREDIFGALHLLVSTWGLKRVSLLVYYPGIPQRDQPGSQEAPSWAVVCKQKNREKMSECFLTIRCVLLLHRA